MSLQLTAYCAATWRLLTHFFLPTQCCDDTADLATVPKNSVYNVAPYSSTVQLIADLYDQVRVRH